MKIKKFITTYEEQEENFLGLTLLSKEEYKKYKNNISVINRFWWLRSPGSIPTHVCSVDWNNNLCYATAKYSWDSVRPALILDATNLDIGDKFKFYNHVWTVISNTYALCDDTFHTMTFRKDLTAKDANVYEKSDIKKYLDNEFEEMMKLNKQPFYDIQY